MAELRKSRLALVGPAAQGLSARLAATGFELADGGAAIIDLADAADRVADVRRRYAPVVGLIAHDALSQSEWESLDAVIRLPHAATDLPPLLRALIRATEDRSELQRQADDMAALVEMTGALAGGGDPVDLLARVVERIAGHLSVERCSLVLGEGDGTGLVVAASDDPTARGRRIDLANYPELREVMATGRPLVIADAQAHPLLDPVRERYADRNISAVAALPMTCEGEVAGVLFVRCRDREEFAPREVRFLCTVASAAAVALRSAGRIESEYVQRVAAEREVSRSRRLEAELRKTKEFLERLIDATADGIVAADMDGNILVFNKGAERMTGFRAADVTGTNVARLYPSGLAASIMRRLRTARAAGEEFGHMRCEVVARTGEVIPVGLSAAIVAEEGRETATVGVFRDLREELRRDAELTQTRERLEEAEKAAVISELAGAAAHELNQPLTSVLGFSELLFRRSQENEKGREELAAILREAERMANIVRKIGRITRYETTPYVGKTRIVDLDRASNPPPVVIRDKP